MFQLKTFFGLLLGLAFIAAVPVADASFCWKDTYGRKVGRLPTDCGTGKENENGLCYNVCPAGYAGEATTCWKSCPDGLSDHGVGCTKSAAYGRGAGYPWKLGDNVGSLDEARARCRAGNPQGCEKNGQIIYPLCKDGYKAFGANLCTPECPAGFSDTGATCLKPKQERGAGTIPGCPSGQENDGGLCYPTCKAGFDGVGPVCWQECKGSTPYGCGAGCVSKKRPAGAPSRGAAAFGKGDECTRVIGEQVMSVLNVAATILTVGTGSLKSVSKEMLKNSIADAVIEGETKAAVKAAIKKQFLDAGQTITENQLANLTNMAMGDDFDYTLLDPTGIAAVVKAYNHDTCPS